MKSVIIKPGGQTVINDWLLCRGVEEMLDELPPAGQLPNPDTLHARHRRPEVVPEVEK